ncbi:MAG: hypothetical protein KA313_07065 [Pseudarcicella sp.]|nr:hypothetical protein [Pseudarcicella sp.]
MKQKIESIENRNNSIFGKKRIIINTFGISVVFSIIIFKVLSTVFQPKTKGGLLCFILAPALFGANFYGKKIQKIDDDEYLIKLNGLNALKKKLIDHENRLISIKESFKIEKSL